MVVGAELERPLLVENDTETSALDAGISNDELVSEFDLTSILEIDPRVFASLQYVIFDTEVLLGPWLGWPTMAQINDPDLNTLSVDWVRVWEADSSDP